MHQVVIQSLDSQMQKCPTRRAHWPKSVASTSDRSFHHKWRLTPSERWWMEMTAPANMHTTSMRWLTVTGYCREREVFLLRPEDALGAPNRSACDSPRTNRSEWMARSWSDLQALDRAVHRLLSASRRRNDDVTHAPSSSLATATPGRIPTRRFRSLMATSWVDEDPSTGWRLELRKNVTLCTQWLNAALASVPASEDAIRKQFVDAEAYALRRVERDRVRQDTQRGRELQQYFTSPELVSEMLTMLTQWLRGQGRAFTMGMDGITWLEPSCGDGRFVSALLTAGARRVIGCELDEQLCATAEANAVATAATMRGSTSVAIQQGDFLSSSMAQVDWMQMQHSDGGDGAQQHPPQLVVAVGNPPFGEAPEAARTESRRRLDLVARFVEHAASAAWGADVIAFVVPARCARAAYLDQVLATLNEGSTNDRIPTSTAIASDPSGALWTVALVEQPKERHTFQCHASQRLVTQPSAFVVLSRVS